MADDTFTALIQRAQASGEDTQDQAFELVYEELRQVALRRIRQAGYASLQPTELVAEAYEKLKRKAPIAWENRRHFFGFAARAMADILADRARAALAQKRGGGALHLPLSEAPELAESNPHGYLTLYDALSRLAEEDPRGADIIRMQYFIGMTVDEIADELGISPSAVDRAARFARARLLEILETTE